MIESIASTQEKLRKIIEKDFEYVYLVDKINEDHEDDENNEDEDEDNENDEDNEDLTS